MPTTFALKVGDVVEVLSEAEIMATVFPHPTMSEAMHEASLDAYGIVLNT